MDQLKYVDNISDKKNRFEIYIYYVYEREKEKM